MVSVDRGKSQQVLNYVRKAFEAGQSSGLASMCDPGPNVNTQIVVALGKLALAVTLARSYIVRDCY